MFPARRRYRALAVGTLALATAAAALTTAAPGFAGERGGHPTTATPIKHLVVIFGENVSFDHYFGTYPKAANTDGTPFRAMEGTPSVNGLTDALLQHNPNSANPQRLGGTAQLVTCDMDHGYTAEQKAADAGLMDKFVEYTGKTCSGQYSAPGLVMDYYDGNTVTGLWNYAQRFAMSDNSFGTTFGPSSPGALNLVSGQTHGVYSVGQDRLPTASPDAYTVGYPDAAGVGTVTGDPDPAWDDCSNTAHPLAAMKGTNVGDLLNARRVTWGWFQGGFRPTAQAGASYDGQPKAVCGATSTNVAGATISDYSPHHEPFQYYASTANPHHLAPSSVGAIGATDQANHQYDMTDFYAALGHGNLPAVDFLKAPMAQDGHAGYSDPIDEQKFVVNVVNALQRSKDWASTAVVVAYDDSDGWYDHVMAPIVNASSGAKDSLQAPGVCGNGTPLGGYEGRCGYGPRLPLLVISPFSRTDYVDSTLTDQSSILRFVEDNWLSGQRIGDGSFDAIAGPLDGMFDWHHPAMQRLLLDPATGATVRDGERHG
jgi:phospholipase C